MSLLSKQKALHAKVSAEGSETLLSPIQLFSSFLRGASRSKSPRSVVKTFQSSLNDCTLKLSSGLFIKRVNLNISNRTQGFFYTRVAVPPCPGLLVSGRSREAQTNAAAGLKTFRLFLSFALLAAG